MVLMVIAVFSLSCMSLLAKVIGPDYHPLQVVFLRNLVAGLIIIPFVLGFGGISALQTSRPTTHFIRAFLGVLGNACYFLAYQPLPLADVMILSQSVPLCVTVFAVPFLKEVVGWRRFTAVIIGLIGVGLAINPAQGISFVSLAALGGPLLWSITILLVRDLGRTDSPYTIAFYYMFIGTILSGLLQPLIWVPLSSDVLLLFLLLGVAGACGQILMSYALKLAEASVVSPFNYTAIVWGIIFDYGIWGVIPEWITITGGLIICGSGYYIFLREKNL